MSDVHPAIPQEYGDVSVIERALDCWIGDSRPDDGRTVIRSVNVELLTSKGDFRPSNQDLVAFVRIPEQRRVRVPLCAAIVADGMGGMTDGEGASALAVSAFIAFLAAGDVSGGMKKLLLGAIEHANFQVHQRYRGAGGATLSAILYGKQGATGIHVGDSRIYGLQASGAVRLTVDDTLAEQLRHAKGNKAAADVPSERDNRLIQFVGLGPSLEPHVVDLAAGANEMPFSHFLLSTDGAHYIGDKLLSQIIEAGMEAKCLGSELISLSRSCGSTDNASLLVVPSGVSMDWQFTNKTEVFVDMPNCALVINSLNRFENEPGILRDIEQPIQKKSDDSFSGVVDVLSDSDESSPAIVKKKTGKVRKSSTRKKTAAHDQVVLGFVDVESKKLAPENNEKIDGKGEN